MIRKLRHAVTERDEQVIAFQKFSDALPQDAVAEWRKQVEVWEQNPQEQNPFYVEHDSTHESILSFILTYFDKVISQSQVRRQLAEEDAADIQSGQRVVIHDEVSLSAMLTIGIDLEEQQ